MSDELVAWLREQLDKDEAVAAAVDPTHDAFNGTGIIVMHLHGGGTRSVTLNSQMARYLLRHDPARVLREIAAKRQLIDEAVETLGREDAWDPVLNGGSGEEYDWARFVLRMIALPYADREGFRPEWAACAGGGDRGGSGEGAGLDRREGGRAMSEDRRSPDVRAGVELLHALEAASDIKTVAEGTCRNCGKPIVFKPYYLDGKQPNPPIWWHPPGATTCDRKPKDWTGDTWPMAEPVEVDAR